MNDAEIDAGQRRAQLMRALAGRRPSRDEIKHLGDALPSRVIVRQTRLDGIPHAFRDSWQHWDAIRQLVCTRLSLDIFCVRLTGSANQGYSYRSGAPWDPTRDLDLFIISAERFSSLESSAREAIRDYERGDRELKRKWSKRNVSLVKSHLRRGFVQTSKLPQFLPWLRPYGLCRRDVGGYAQEHGFAPGEKKVSFRIYRDLDAAEQQLERDL